MREVADGTLMLKDNGVVVSTTMLTGFRGAGTSTVSVTPASGVHQYIASIALANGDGTSAVSSSAVGVTVLDAISTIDALKFDITGADKVEYSGRLRYEGDLGASASSFSPLSVSAKSGQILCLKEHVRVKFGGPKDVDFTVSATANGQSRTESVKIHVHHWWHCPRWKIDEIASGACCHRHG